MSNQWQKANLLPRYYSKSAKSIGNLAGHFRIMTFEFGHDPSLINTSTNPPTLSSYDSGRNDTPNKFYTGAFASGDVVYNESDGRLLFKCRMPENTLTEPKEHSLTVLRDADGDVVAVSVDLPDWVAPDEGVETHPFINFPLS